MCLAKNCIYRRLLISERPVFNQVVMMLNIAFKKIPNYRNLILHSDHECIFFYSRLSHQNRQMHLQVWKSVTEHCFPNSLP